MQNNDVYNLKNTYRFCKKVSLLLAILVILPYLLSVLFAVTFKVHTHGIVVVTGASSGLGEHAAATLATQTEFIVYAGVRKQADAARLESTYPGIRSVILDVTSQKSIDAAVEKIIQENKQMCNLWHYIISRDQQVD